MIYEKKMTDIKFWKKDDIFDLDALKSLIYSDLTVDPRKKKRYNLLKIFHCAMKHKLKYIPELVSAATSYERKTYWDLTMTTLWVSKMRTVNVAFSNAYVLLEHIRDAIFPDSQIEWHALYILKGTTKKIFDDTLETRRIKYEVLIPLSYEYSTETRFGKLHESFSNGCAIILNKPVKEVHILKKRLHEQIFLYAKILDLVDVHTHV